MEKASSIPLPGKRKPEVMRCQHLGSKSDVPRDLPEKKRSTICGEKKKRGYQPSLPYDAGNGKKKKKGGGGKGNLFS